MSYERAIKEEITRATEIFTFHFWEKVVGIINEKLASESFPPQLEMDMWDMSPKEIVVNVVKIQRDENYPIIFNREDEYIDVGLDAYIQLEGMRRWGSGFPLILRVYHRWLLQKAEWKNLKWECWVSYVHILSFRFLSSVGEGQLSLSPDFYLVGPPSSNTDVLRLSEIRREHLNSKALQFLTNTILVLSSSTAASLHVLIHNVVQAVLSGFVRLYRTVWELPNVKLHDKGYAFVHYVSVPNKPSSMYFSLGVVDSAMGALPSYSNGLGVDLFDIKLHVEFFTGDGKSLGIKEVVVFVKIRIELDKPIKGVDLYVDVRYQGSGFYHARVSLFEFNDPREIPSLDYVDIPRHPAFTRAIERGFEEIFSFIVTGGAT